MLFEDKDDSMEAEDRLLFEQGPVDASECRSGKVFDPMHFHKEADAVDSAQEATHRPRMFRTALRELTVLRFRSAETMVDGLPRD